LSACAESGLLRIHHPGVAPFADCSALDTWRFVSLADCSVIRIAPLHESLRLDVSALCWSRIAPCSTLRTPHRVRIAPYSTLSALCPFGLLRVAACAALDTLRSCDGHELLRVRRLAFHAEPGLLLAPRFPPCAGHGLLHVQHSEFRTGHGLLCDLDCSASRVVPCSTLDARCQDSNWSVTRIAPLHESLRVRHLPLCTVLRLLRVLDLSASRLAPRSILSVFRLARIAP
jgi:hypothetical protein